LQAKGLIEMLHPDHLSPQALANWLAQTDKSPQIRDRVDLNALTRIPKFLEALLSTSISQQKAS
jgi:predicted glycosyltransferase